jgi:WD40 repeat protein
MIRISIVEQGGTSRLMTFQSEQVTLGRLPENDLCLTGQGVSSRHARLFSAPEGLYLEDLGSTNGTFVNRHRITGPVRVTQADEIVLAVYQLRVFDGVQTSAPAGGVRAVAAASGAGPEASPAARPPAMVPASGPAIDPTKPATAATGGPTKPVTTGATAGIDPKAAQWAREWESIDILARDWIARGKDRKKLLRGAKLAHAKQWLASGRGRQPVPKREHKDFIKASHQAAQLRLFRNVATGGLALGAIAFGVVLVVAKPSLDPLDRGFSSGGIQSQRPRTEGSNASQRRAESDELAKVAQSQLATAPAAAALVAVEALRRLPEAEQRSDAHEVVRRALEHLGYDTLPAHEGAIHDAVFSPDDRWVVTAGSDLSARLWSLRQAGRRIPMSLRGHGQAVRHLAVSPDSRFLYTGGDDGRVFRWSLTEADPPTTSFALPGHEAALSAMRLSGDGSVLVTASVDGTVRIHAVGAGSGGTRVSDHLGPVRDVDIDAKGTRVITGGADATAMLYTLADGQPTRKVRLEGHEGEIRAAVLAPDASWALTTSDDGTGRLWDPTRRLPGLNVRVLAGHQGPVTHAVITEDSKLAITGGKDGKLFVWDLEASQPELGATTFDLHQGEILDLGTSGPGPDEDRPEIRWLYSASADGTARTWNLETRQRSQESVKLDGGSPVGVVAASRDGRLVLTGGDDGLARLWDPAEKGGAGAARVARGAGPVLAVSLNEVGTRLAVAGAEGRVLLWDVISSGPPSVVASLDGHVGRVRAVAFTADSEFLATGGDDGTVRLWKASSADPGAGHLALKGHTKVVNDLAFTPDGRRLISISADRTARVWQMSRDPSQTVTVLRHDDELNSMSLSEDGRWLLTGSISRIRLWDLSVSKLEDGGRNLRHPHEKDISVVAIGPKGRFGLSASVDAIVVLWSFAEGGKSTRLRQHDQPVDAAAFSPDGRWLATGSQDKTIRLYDLEAEHPEETSVALVGHEQRVGVVAFSRDSRVLVSGSGDGTLRVWTLRATDLEATARTSEVWRGHDGLLSDLVIARDGRIVASGSYDGSARIWPTLPADLAEIACRRVGRSLTPEEWKRWLGDRPHRSTCDDI